MRAGFASRRSRASSSSAATPEPLSFAPGAPDDRIVVRADDDDLARARAAGHVHLDVARLLAVDLEALRLHPVAEAEERELDVPRRGFELGGLVDHVVLAARDRLDVPAQVVRERPFLRRERAGRARIRFARHSDHVPEQSRNADDEREPEEHAHREKRARRVISDRDR